jgi:D-alanyl-D-alanine carboxypeptidase
MSAAWIRRVGPALAVLAVAGALAGPAAAAPAPAEAPLPPALQKKLSKALDSSLAETKAPGAIVGVWIGDRGWTATRGSTRKGKTLTPSLEEHTRIGSITKTFTGTVILQLVDEGKLKLSDTIDRWFPWVPNADAITIRELGDMSSGINTYTLDGPIVDRYLTSPTTTWKPGELIIGGVSEPPKFAPGQGFFYSNTNFLMLGHIAEKVTGEPLARLMRERIFGPLGMTHTTYPFVGELPTPFWNGYTNQAVNGTPVRDATHWSPTFLGPAGQIVSTLADMRKYVKALGTGSLISPGAQRDRLQANPFSVGGGREYDFALGTDHGWLSHSGEVPGFNSEIAYLPKLKASIVVFTNTDIANRNGGAPAPTVLSALGKAVAPGNVPTP